MGKLCVHIDSIQINITAASNRTWFYLHYILDTHTMMSFYLFSCIYSLSCVTCVHCTRTHQKRNSLPYLTLHTLHNLADFPSKMLSTDFHFPDNGTKISRRLNETNFCIKSTSIDENLVQYLSNLHSYWTLFFCT